MTQNNDVLWCIILCRTMVKKINDVFFLWKSNEWIYFILLVYDDVPKYFGIPNTNINIYFWTFPIEIWRKYQMIMTRLRIGYTKIANSHLMSKLKLPICWACGVQVTIQHIVYWIIVYQHQNNPHTSRINSRNTW